MLSAFLTFIVALAVSTLVLPIIISYSKRKKLYVKPGRRRIHKKITPSFGGVAIFLGFVMTSLIWTDAGPLASLETILLIPFVIGLLDDLFHIKPAVKLTGQFITGTLIFFVLNEQISSFYGLLDFGSVHPVFSYVLTLLVITIFTNAFNLIDGIDGLAGTIAFVSFIFFSIWFYNTGDLTYALICIAMLGAIAAFLFYNWEPAKIFMGDTGTLTIGTMLAVMAIHFVNSDYNLANGILKFHAPITTALCVVIIPVIDTIRIIVIRVRSGISIFTPDKRHIHHALLRLGCKHHQAVLILGGTQLLFIGLAVLMRNMSDRLAFPVAAAVAILITIWLDRALGLKMRPRQEQASKSVLQQTT